MNTFDTNKDLTPEDFQKLDKSQIILSEQFLLLGTNFSDLTFEQISKHIDIISTIMDGMIKIIKPSESIKIDNSNDTSKTRIRSRKLSGSGN